MNFKFGKAPQELHHFLEQESLEERNNGQLYGALKGFVSELYQNVLSGKVYDFKAPLCFDPSKGFQFQQRQRIDPTLALKKLGSWEKHGFAYEVTDGNTSILETLASSLFEVNSLKVAPGLSAPEAFLGHHDMRSDVWTVGVLTTALCSSLSLSSIDDYRLLLSGDLDQLRWKDLKAKTLADQCLVLNPSERIQFPEVLDHLESLLKDYQETDIAALSTYDRILKGFKASLLDFSSRNQLFHFKENSAHIPLSCSVSDLVKHGHRFSLSASENGAELERLHRIRRKQQKDLREKGTNDLYAIRLFAKWLHAESNELVNSPLLLQALDLKMEKGFEVSYELQAPENTLMVNEVIRVYFKEHFDWILPATVAAEEAAIEAFCAELEQGFQEKGAEQWELIKASVFGNFSYRNTVIALDYDRLIGQPASPLLERVLGFSKEAHIHSESLLTGFSEKVYVLPADVSQEKALQRARKSSLVIEGPPGTGKSQTIVNLLAQAVNNGEKVLFVSEKRPALDVVYNRLAQVQLEALALLVHDQIKEKAACIGSIKKGYERLSEPLARRASLGKQLADWKLEELLEQLDHYYAQVRSQKNGYTLNELFLTEQHNGADVPEAFVPDYAQWSANRDLLKSLSDLMHKAFGHDNWSQSSLMSFNERLVTQSENPIAAFQENLEKASKATEALKEVERKLAGDRTMTLGDLLQIRSFCRSIKWLVERDLTKLVLEDNTVLNSYTQLKNDYLSKKALYEKRKLKSGLSTEASLRELESAQLELKERGKSPELVSFVKEVLEIDGEWFTDDVSGILRNAILAQKSAEQLVVFESKFFSKFKSNDPEGFIEQVSLLQDISQRTAYHLPEFFEELNQKRFPDRILNLVLQVDDVLVSLEESAIWLHKGFRELSLADLRKYILGLQKSFQMEERHVHLLRQFHDLPDALKYCLGHANAGMEDLVRLSAEKEVKRAYTAYPDLEKYSTDRINRESQALSEAYDDWLQWNAAHILDSKVTQLHELSLLAEIPTAKLSEEEKQRKWAFKKGLRLHKHEFDKSKQHKSLRELFRTDAAEVIEQIKPICLMSPSAVSEVFPCKAEMFDLVVFDEASQVRLEDVLPICYRAKRIVVVGDAQQLPPSNFFRSQGLKANTKDGLEFSSFLMACRATFPVEQLSWHYRSASTELIDFSNAAFYGRSLKAFPHAEQLTDPFRLRYVEDSCYQHQENLKEAEALVKDLKEEMLANPNMSFAVVALSEKQTEAVNKALASACAEDLAFQRLLDRQEAGSQDGSFNGLIVRNLESMQGEERDVVYVSIGYGPDKEGKFAARFGPIMHEGGERRLNVLFSRARKGMRVYASFQAEEIENDHNMGLWTLKQYLKFAKAVESHDESLQQDVLALLSGKYAQGVEHNIVLSSTQLKVYNELENALAKEGCSLKTVQFGNTSEIFFEMYKEGLATGVLLALESESVNTWQEVFMARNVLEKRGYQVVQVSTQEVGRAPQETISLLLNAF